MTDKTLAMAFGDEPPIRYAIRDGRGRRAATLVRFADKTFAWYRSDGRLGLGGIGAENLPLFGSERLRRVPVDTMIVIVEGTKVVEVLWRRAVPALGTVTGASGTPNRAVLEVLRGRPVLLWPDNDVVGIAHLRRVGDLLRGIAAEVWWIEPGDHLPAGGDAADVEPSELAGFLHAAVPFCFSGHA